MKFVSAIILCLYAAVLFGEVELIKNSQPKISIVIAPDAPDYTRYAANELSVHLKERCGAEIPVGTAVKPGTIPFYLGFSPEVRPLGLSADNLKPDGFILKITPEYVVIAGRDLTGKPPVSWIHPMRWQETLNEKLKLGAFGEAGTMNGVYRFLEEYAGVRWYMTGDLGKIVPQSADLIVPEIDKIEAPDFEYRYPWFCNFSTAPENAVWFRRAGYGAPFPVAINHNYNQMRGQKDAHPEYFALIDGKRDFDNLSVVVGGGNYCLSNPGLAEAWIKVIGDYFDKNPNQKLYPLCPNDGMLKICECPECQKQLSPHLGEDGKFSNYIWGFTNRIAKEIARKYPDRYIGTFAYEKYRQPPEIDDLSPNVAVMICYSRQDLRDLARKSAIHGLIAKWAQKTPTLYFWTYPIFDYWRPFRGFPCFYPHLIQEDMQFHKKIGAKGEFLESEFKMPGDPDMNNQYIVYPGLSHLSAYIRAKLLWATDLNLDTLLNEYYRLFYGPAEDAMREFWSFAEQTFMAKFTDHPVRQYAPADITRMMQILDRALQATPQDSVYHRRVALIKDEMQPFARQLMNALEEKRPLEVPFVNDEITFTKSLDTPLWRKAKGWKMVAKDGTPAGHATMIYTLANSKGLAFAFVNFEPETGKLTTRTTQRDTGEVWNDDNVEIMICPDDESFGIQYIITAAGNLWDGSWQKGNSLASPKWNGNAKIITGKSADRWTVQVFIPWSDLKITADQADNLKLNIYRTRVVGKSPDYSAFSPMMNHNHLSPEFFAPLKLIR